MDHLRLGVDRHAADLPEIFRRGLLQQRVAVVGIAAILWLARLLVERLNDAGVGHCVRLAHPEVEELRVRIRLHGRAFRPFDLLKLVDGIVLAIPPAADAFGEQILNVTILHGLHLSGDAIRRNAFPETCATRSEFDGAGPRFSRHQNLGVKFPTSQRDSSSRPYSAKPAFP